MRKQKKGFLQEVAPHWQLYVCLFLPILYLLIFRYYPMLGVQIAFKRFTIRGGIWNSPWIGFSNFYNFFTSYQFGRVLPNTLRISLYQLIAGFPVPVILALCFNVIRRARIKKIIQTITYIPHFISTVVLVGMLLQLMNAHVGLYGMLYKIIAGQVGPDLLGRPKVFPHLYVWSGIWQSAGWGTIIYMAALSAVDPELLEAAQIDGASRFKRVINIDLPAILPTISIMLILQAGRLMDVGFEKVYLMQNSLNLSTSEVISTYVYKVGLTGGSDFAYGAAIGLFNSVINFTLLLIVNKITRYLSESSLW